MYCVCMYTIINFIMDQQHTTQFFVAQIPGLDAEATDCVSYGAGR